MGRTLYGTSPLANPDHIEVHCLHCSNHSLQMHLPRSSSDPELEFWSHLNEGETAGQTRVKDAATAKWRGRILRSSAVLQVLGGLLLCLSGTLACVAQVHTPCRHETKAQMALSLNSGVSLMLTGATALIASLEILDINCTIVAFVLSSVLSAASVLLLLLLSAWNLWMDWHPLHLADPNSWPFDIIYQIAIVSLAAITSLNSSVSLCYFCCRRKQRNWWVAVGNLEDAPRSRRRRQGKRDREDGDSGKLLRED